MFSDDHVVTRHKAVLADQNSHEYIYLYFPFLPILRLARQHQLDMQQPIALYHRMKGVDRIIYLSAHAQAAGLETAMSVPDARACVPHTLFYEADTRQDYEMLQRLARWAWRYSPRTGVDREGLGIWVDMTGASHLRGGISATLQDMLCRLHQADLVTKGAASSYYAASWALAHFHPDADTGINCFGNADKRYQILDQLNIGALRLDTSLQADLARSGLRQIGDIRIIGNADIAMRFGKDVVIRLEQLCHQRTEELVPIRPFSPIAVHIRPADPICGAEPIAQMVKSLITDMAKLLMQQEKQARSFEIGWQCTDGHLGHLNFRLSRPSNDMQIILRLCQDAGQHINAEFGIDYGWMKAGGLVDDQPVTALLGTDPQALSEVELDYLIDTLAARLGPEKVQRAIPKQSWQVEKAEQRAEFASAENRHLEWECVSATHLKAPRPIRLMNPAEPVQTVSLLPDHPPHMLKWRKKQWKVARASGPERVGPAWWDNARSYSRSRDYYRLQLEDGPRIWVYREGLAERGDPIKWYMQGFFA